MSYLALRHRAVDEAVDTPAALPFAPAAQLLSDREHEISVLVTRGFSNKEIALELRISPWTVSAHLRRVFTKLDISRRIELCLLLQAPQPWHAPDPSRRAQRCVTDT